MKNEYKKPVVKMIDYAYQEQVVASSSPVGDTIDAVGTGECTWRWPNCDLLYTTDHNCMQDVNDFPIT